MAKKTDSRQQSVIEAMSPFISVYPWVLTVKDEKSITGPVLIIRERVTENNDKTRLLAAAGKISGSSFRAAKEAIAYMAGQVKDDVGRSLDLQSLFDDRMAFRGDIPLDRATGSKLALLFKLHPQIRNEKRIELLAWRIERFTMEEATYWLGKVSLPTYGKRSVEWAKSGLRLMLAGQTSDMKEIEQLLDQLRK